MSAASHSGGVKSVGTTEGVGGAGGAGDSCCSHRLGGLSLADSTVLVEHSGEGEAGEGVHERPFEA